MAKAKHYKWARGGPLPKLERHSEVKHSVLRDYLVDYFLTLVARPEQDQIRLTIVDGFCGGGLYLNSDGEEVPGSPIVILEAVKEAKFRVMQEFRRLKDIKFDVQLICTDASGSALEHLRQVLEDRGYGGLLRRGDIELIEGAFADQAPALIARAKSRSPKSGRALFVLDQYGYGDVPVTVLQGIFSTLKRPEVILTFYVDSLINYLSPDNLKAFERNTGLTGAITASDLDKRGPGWRRLIQSLLYERIKAQSGASYFTPFFVRPQKGHGDYWLLHLSQHWKARDVMAQTHWGHHNHFVHYAEPGLNMFSTGYATRIDDKGRSQAAFEFDDLANKSSMRALHEQIPKILSGLPGGVRFRDFFIEQVNSTPATKSMIERAILDLAREKEIKVTGEDGSVRHVRMALKGDHVLRLQDQRAMIFIP
ncbi:MAG: three-Cys-motif partner protein TcmP [Burkholderiaceae bacterium]|nr:three-Cys-motif partner protein TcmP [Burkholderiaceae bacterium]